MDKSIGGNDISMLNSCHLLLGPDLTNSSRTAGNSNVRPLEQLRRDLPHIDYGNIILAKTYLKQYCNQPVEMEDRRLYETQPVYKWSSRKGFSLCNRGKGRIFEHLSAVFVRFRSASRK